MLFKSPIFALAFEKCLDWNIKCEFCEKIRNYNNGTNFYYSPVLREKDKETMKELIQYSIPVKGLGLGMHQYEFTLDQEFFKYFENSPISESEIALKVYFDKREDMYVFTFDFEGTAGAQCDRCLVDIKLPIKGAEQLIVKFSEEEREEMDIVYVSHDTPHINLSRYIYEYVSLGMPLIKVYDCEEDENPPCDEDLLDKLYEKPAPEETETGTNPIWDALKGLNDN